MPVTGLSNRSIGERGPGGCWKRMIELRAITWVEAPARCSRAARSSADAPDPRTPTRRPENLARSLWAELWLTRKRSEFRWKLGEVGNAYSDDDFVCEDNLTVGQLKLEAVAVPANRRDKLLFKLSHETLLKCASIGDEGFQRHRQADILITQPLLPTILGKRELRVGICQGRRESL